ncbi:hypothetical protein IWQ62_006272 [Dispira parvispora]|uniref:Uncharacterized protein n=1 Tax=Dispira parvispora TaxID=1520584 RepID=A0A9W8DYR7_9FUNG|nr:hypothetical protein IWQ62_006272 [Dispira parvispora]
MRTLSRLVWGRPMVMIRPLGTGLRPFHSQPTQLKLWDTLTGRLRGKPETTPASSDPSAAAKAGEGSLADQLEGVNAKGLEMSESAEEDDLAPTLAKPLTRLENLDAKVVEEAVRGALAEVGGVDVQSESSAWTSYTFQDTDEKYQVLLQTMQTLQVDIPNRNLNNIRTGQDVVDYYLGKDTPIALTKVHAVAKYYREHKDQLPETMQFIPYVLRSARQSDL